MDAEEIYQQKTSWLLFHHQCRAGLTAASYDINHILIDNFALHHYQCTYPIDSETI